MNKQDLINVVASKAGTTKEQAGKMIDILFGCIGESLNKGEDVSVTDFGKWNLKTLNERKGINPITKKPIIIPSKKKVVFKAFKKCLLYSQKY